MEEKKSIIKFIPAWMRIKNELLDSFYRCNFYLTEFRKIVITKDSPQELNAHRLNIWLSFVSELVGLYSISKTTLRKNKKTSQHYTFLKGIEKYQLELGKLTYKDGIGYFNVIEEALYYSGLLDVGIKKMDPHEAALEGLEY